MLIILHCLELRLILKLVFKRYLESIKTRHLAKRKQKKAHRGGTVG